MPYLAAGVILVGVLAIVNLVFTMAVIRKLREMTRPPDPGGLAVGAELPTLTATTTTGLAVTERILAGADTLVGVFSTDCDACLELLPGFVSAARRHEAGGGQSFAIVVEGTAPAAEMVAALADVSMVTVEARSDSDGVAGRLDVRAFPYFCLVEDGRVARSGHELVTEQPDPVPATR